MLGNDKSIFQPELVKAETNPLTGGIGYSTPSASVAIGSLAPTGRRLVLLGDSLSELAGGPGAVSYSSASLTGRQFWNHYNTYSGHRLTLVYNAGRSGELLASINARIPTQVVPARPDVVSYLGGTNDVITNRTSAQIIADWTAGAKALMQVSCFVHCFTLPPMDTSVAGYSTTWPKVICEVNEYIKQFCELVSGFVCTDIFGILVDPASTTCSPLSGVMEAVGSVHPNNYGMSLIADDMVANCNQIYPAKPYGLRSTGDAYATASINGNYVANGLFTVDSNVDGLADGMSFGQISGLPTAVHSLVARTGRGNWQQSVITSAAANNRASLIRYGSGTPFTVGDVVYAECDFNILSPTNLKNYQMTIQAVDGVSNPLSNAMTKATGIDVNLPGNRSGTLRTLPITIGATGSFACQVDVYTEFSGVGGCTLQLNGLRIVKVNPVIMTLRS